MRLLSMLVLLVSIPSLANAQTTNGRIVGTVTDGSGAVVPGAKVSVVNPVNNSVRAIVADSLGTYVVPNLAIGDYSVTVEAPGFKQHVRQAVRVEIDYTARVDVTLEPGAVSESVTVAASISTVQTDQSSVGQVVENQTIVELPLNGRNFIRLGSLLPGTTQGAPGNTVVRSRQENEALTVNGQRAEHNNYMLDGADNNETLFGAAVIVPSVDAIQEFKVQTANYSAEFGRAAGAVVNVGIKSGSNQLRGTLYEFLRNDALDARDFFDVGVTPLRRNQFGASAGGPVIQNRVFIFGNYEALRERRSNTRGFVVPTERMRAGDFSGMATLFDPQTQQGTGARQPFPENRIPANRIHPVSSKLLSVWPLPNNPSDPARNYIQNFNNPLDRDQFHVRGDWHMRTADQFMTRVSWTDSSDVAPNIAYSGETTNNKHKSGVANWNHIFSPVLLNEARFSAALYNFQLIPDGLGTDFTTALGLPSFALSENVKRHPSITIRNMQGAGGNASIPLFRKTVTYQWIDQATWIRGRQTLKFGIDVRRFQTNNFQPQNSVGAYIFNGPFTAQTNGLYSNGFADFLLGLPQEERILNPLGFDAGRLRNTRLSMYLQDDVNLTSKLTVNAGLRWERDGNWTEANNRWGYFDFAAGQVVYPKSAPISVRIPYPHRFEDVTVMKRPTNKAFAPRFGLAWRPFGGNRTVVRSAYGIFWSQPMANIFLSGTTYPPFALQQSAVSSTNRPELTFGIFPGVTADSLVPVNPTFFAFDPVDFTNGYVQQWNLLLERELIDALVGSVGYVGSKGTHLERREEGNPALPPGPGSVNDRRRFPQFRSITYQNSNSYSTYHSLQIKAERRYRSGLSVLAGYTWSKSLDDTSAWTGLGGQESPLAQDPSRVFLEKARSGFDLRHRFTATALYELPFRFSNAILGTAIAGWQISGILTLQTGFPLTATVGGDSPNAGTGNVRPDLLQAPNLSGSARTIDRWFNTAAFRAPAPFTFGTAGRNIIDGPGARGLDMSVMKLFRLTERQRLQVRGEFFNLPNHPNFGLPNAALGNAAFGTIRSGGAGRECQVAVKYLF